MADTVPILASSGPMKARLETTAHEDATARVLAVERARFDGPYHHHPAVELTWIVAGSGVRVVDGRVAPFEAGDLVLVPAHVPHVWWSRGDAPRATARVLHLSVPQALRALPEGRALQSMVDANPRPAVLAGRLRAAVQSDFESLAGCEGLERLGRALALFARILAARRDVEWLPPATPSAATDDDDARLGRVLRWIHTNLARPLAVADAARRLSVAPASFSRAFQRRVGRPFTVYVNDVRVAEACLLLRESTQPIAEVAHRCGFPTLGHFHRQLVRRTGLGPRAYRAAFALRP